MLKKIMNRKIGVGIIRLRCLVTNIQGLPNTCHVDTLNPKKSKIQRRVETRRTGCNARVGFKMRKGSYKWWLYKWNYTHILVDKMTIRKNNVQKFSFGFKVEKKQLNAIFWANNTFKTNYKEFDGVVSLMPHFQLTCYNYNVIVPLIRYGMEFIFFIEIDNHKKFVTFGVRLLSIEYIESYTWFLNSFLKAFGKQPILVLSDQDTSMKNKITNVFLQSTHRLCM
uniref:MULE transposase domain-containing protein n=1 Tax=Lactuca sativa TaxID=4236 RepID=A0A9R1XPX0_LACSA|nr:hypothetical protein LSAT_V11C200063850 [Lactuca sativa]